MISFSYCRNKSVFWTKIFRHHHEKYPHILLLVELCLVQPWSSATVERGFSMMGRVITDWRASLNNDTIDDLLIISINVRTLLKLDEGIKSKIVRKAVQLYLDASKRGR